MLGAPNQAWLTVKSLRAKRGWSQEHLAAVSGVNARTIQRIEKGDCAAIETKIALAGAFDIEVWRIFPPSHGLRRPYAKDVLKEDDLAALKTSLGGSGSQEELAEHFFKIMRAVNGSLSQQKGLKELYLHWIRSGKDLMALISRSSLLSIDSLEIVDEDDRNAVQSALDLTKDWSDIWSEVPAVDKRQAEDGLTEVLQDLVTRGYLVFGTTIQRRYRFEDGKRWDAQVAHVVIAPVSANGIFAWDEETAVLCAGFPEKHLVQ